MMDVIFPKRAPSARERDTRPVPSDYRPKQLRAVAVADVADDDYYGDEPGSLPELGINLHKFEDELTRNRLSEIATLVRLLTYGEMMALAQAIWNIRPTGPIDKQSLPMLLHLWSTTSPDAADARAEGETAEQ
jgi:hypothetical protein